MQNCTDPGGFGEAQDSPDNPHGKGDRGKRLGQHGQQGSTPHRPGLHRKLGLVQLQADDPSNQGYGHAAQNAPNPPTRDPGETVQDNHRAGPVKQDQPDQTQRQRDDEGQSHPAPNKGRPLGQC